MLPIDLDLRAIQDEDQYQDPLPQEDDTDPTASFEDSVTIGQMDDEESRSRTVSGDAASLSDMHPPERRPSAPDTNDNESEAVPQPRITNERPDPFVVALGLWCKEAGVARSQYTSLLEVLNLLGPHPSLQKLPHEYSTLKRKLVGHLPQLPLRRALVPITAEKMATLPEKRKAEALQHDLKVPKEFLYFFDLPALFTRLLLSELKTRFFFGLGHFVDVSSELWHSRSWLSSVRTISGQYARYRNGSPCLPSDFVEYEYSRTDGISQVALGRVLAVGLDYRSCTPLHVQGGILLQIQRALVYDNIPIAYHQQRHFAEDEILLTAHEDFVSESALVQPAPFLISLKYDDSLYQLSAPSPQPTSHRVVRTIQDSDGLFQALAQSHPVRAELEISQYGRDYFTIQFNAAINLCLSIPYFMFIDAFGLYRNSYRSLVGVYLILGVLQHHERNRRANVFPVTLSPHGSNLNSALIRIDSIRELDRGLVLYLPEPTLVCAFPLAFLGDMPAQQANGAFKSQRADLSCRFCTVRPDERGKLDFDLKGKGRYHYQTLQLRREMHGKPARKAREDFAQKNGFVVEDSALFRLAPALDIILTRPGDTAHSEFKGQCFYLHQLFLEAMLTGSAKLEYATVLRTFPFPPGYARLQSPLHHLKSYSMSDHGRWMVIAPILLRCWLREKHLKTHYLTAIQKHLRSVSDPVTVSQCVVKAFATVAKSTTLLMARSMASSTRETLGKSIKEGRAQFQMLIQFAATAKNLDPRSRSVTPRRPSVSQGQGNARGKGKGKAIPLILPSVETESRASSPGVGEDTEQQSKGALEYLNDQRRPNVHTGLHYETTAEEYGFPGICNVLMGEEKHRYSLSLVSYRVMLTSWLPQLLQKNYLRNKPQGCREDSTQDRIAATVGASPATWCIRGGRTSDDLVDPGT